MIVEREPSKEIDQLFERSQDSSIWSCLQGVMGHLYAPTTENPISAMAWIGDFCFLAGKPDKELVSYKPQQREREFVIMVPQNEGWGEVIADYYKEKMKKVTRYAMKNEPEVFDDAVLEQAVRTLPEEYVIKMIDRELFMRCRNIPWCKDWVSQYENYELYQKHGLGAVVLKGKEIVAGASSYSGYLGGIEVEIDTKEEFRRRGLAYVCGAKLILECRKRGWYASWDAQNKWSKALAEKLGYHYDYEYAAYEIRGWGSVGQV